MINVEKLMEMELNRAIAEELILEKHPAIDVSLFEEAFSKANGNGWDAAILYDLIPLGKKLLNEHPTND